MRQYALRPEGREPAAFCPGQVLSKLHVTKERLPLTGSVILLNAIRPLARARWFTAVAAITLTLGLGINIAVFAMVDRILFRPLPYDEPHRLFVIQEVDLETGQRKSSLPARYFTEARLRLGFIEAM